MTGRICGICQYKNPELAAYCASCEMPLTPLPTTSPTACTASSTGAPPPAPSTKAIVKAHLRAQILKPPSPPPVSEAPRALVPQPIKPPDAMGWRIPLAWLIDGALLLALGFCVFLGLIYQTGGPIEQKLSNGGWFLLYPRAIFISLMITLCFGALYETIFGRGRGSTLGRKSLGLRLEPFGRNRLSPLLIFGRSCLACLSALCFGAGFFWAIVDEHGRTWHDILTGTRLKTSRPTEPGSSEL